MVTGAAGGVAVAVNFAIAINITKNSARLQGANGTLDVTGAHEAEGLGAWEQASLFSPMFAFADQPAAVATAREVMRLLRQSWSETSDRERTR